MDARSNTSQRKWLQFKLRTLFLLLLCSGPIVLYTPQIYDGLFPAKPELPPAFWDDENVQYFPASTDFQLSREAQALKEARAAAQSTNDTPQRDGDF